jgi:glycerol uptake facilitator-like aquaporin
MAYLLAKQVVTFTPPSITAAPLRVFLAELVFTFALVSTVLHVAATKAVQGNSYFGLALGLVVTT